MLGKTFLRIFAMVTIARLVVGQDPTSFPSSQPSAIPSSLPSSQPSGQPSAIPSSQPSSSPTVGLTQCLTNSVCSSTPLDSVLTTSPNTCLNACPSGTTFVQIILTPPAFTGCLCFSTCPLEPLPFGNSTIYAVSGEICPTYPPSFSPTIAPTSTSSVLCESGFICNSTSIGVLLTTNPAVCASQCLLQNGSSRYFDFLVIPPIFTGCLCHSTCPLVPAPAGVVTSEVSAINGAICPLVPLTPTVTPSLKPTTSAPQTKPTKSPSAPQTKPTKCPSAPQTKPTKPPSEPTTPKPKSPTEPPSKPKPPSEPTTPKPKSPVEPPTKPKLKSVSAFRA